MVARYCTECESPKVVRDFYGLRGCCRVCAREWAKAVRRGERRPRASRFASAAEKARAWEAAHPAQAQRHSRVASAAYRARQRGVFRETVDPDVVLQRDNGVCGICEEPVSPDFQIDHVRALARGGEHSYANAQLAHPSCNFRKRVS